MGRAVFPTSLVGLAILARGPKRWRGALAYGLCLALVWLPATLWRIEYYGDFFPNTYYA